MGPLKQNHMSSTAGRSPNVSAPPYWPFVSCMDLGPWSFIGMPSKLPYHTISRLPESRLLFDRPLWPIMYFPRGTIGICTVPLLSNTCCLLGLTRRFLQSFRMIQLRAAVFLSTAVAGLYVDLGFLATGGALLPFAIPTSICHNSVRVWLPGTGLLARFEGLTSTRCPFCGQTPLSRERVR